jgi:flagellum-specific peptidoglycan hydrolase FlgJ
MKYILFFSILYYLSISSVAQKSPQIEKYLNQYSLLAIEEQKRTGVPAAIKLAQAIHESGAGQGALALRSNNHFGIKCKSNWTGATAYHDDDEKGECFRSYDSVASSFRDHSDFLKNSKRYAFLFELEPTDYKGWANGLKSAGYATNPKYPTMLINIIETYELNEFSIRAVARIQSNHQNIDSISRGTTFTAISNFPLK